MFRLIITSLVIFSVLAIAGFVLADESDVPEATGAEDTEDVSDLEVEYIAPSTMLHFVMDVRWGDVRGKVQDRTETMFDGWINLGSSHITGYSSDDALGSSHISGYSLGKVSLIKTLLFETHNDHADKITSKHDPVSWNSLIYGHWDGVRVLVSAPASTDVNIHTAQGGMKRTAQYFYEMDEPYVLELANGKEIVVKTHPYKHRHYFLKIIWGDIERESGTGAGEYNFSGSFKIDSGGKLKLIRTIQFESAWRCLKKRHILGREGNKVCVALLGNRDRILRHSRSEIEWRSDIYGGIDGILVRLNLEKGVDKDDTVTLSFPERGFEKSYPILDLYHDRVTKEDISVDSETGYGAILSVWQKPNKWLIRAIGRPEVYQIEDGAKRHVPSPEVFNANGLNWEDIEEVPEDEVESYAEGDEVVYPDGILIQGSGPEVYTVADGKKRHIVSPAVFSGLGYKWGLIKKVSDDDLSLYEAGENLDADSSHPEGALIRVEGTPTVWKIEGGKKKPVPGLAVFYAHKFDWQNVLVTDQSHADDFESGDEVEYPDGSLLSSPDGKVYDIDKGKKRWIKSALDLTNAGYDWDDIVTVSQQDLAKYEKGDEIIGEDQE